MPAAEELGVAVLRLAPLPVLAPQALVVAVDAAVVVVPLVAVAAKCRSESCKVQSRGKLKRALR